MKCPDEQRRSDTEYEKSGIVSALGEVGLSLHEYPRGLESDRFVMRLSSSTISNDVMIGISEIDDSTPARWFISLAHRA